jgi:hypothetical protein
MILKAKQNECAPVGEGNRLFHCRSEDGTFRRLEADDLSSTDVSAGYVLGAVEPSSRVIKKISTFKVLLTLRLPPPAPTIHV